MNETFLIIAVVFPIVTAVFIPLIPFRERAHMEVYIEAVVLLTSALVLLLLFNRPGELVLLQFSEKVSFALKIDGMSMVFAGLVSVLWPIATLYSFEYMSTEEREQPFFMFYTMTYGVTLGIAFSANIVSMYFFYEMLTLVTIPLVLHTFTREAGPCDQEIYLFLHRRAARSWGWSFWSAAGAPAGSPWGGSSRGIRQALGWTWCCCSMWWRF